MRLLTFFCVVLFSISNLNSQNLCDSKLSYLSSNLNCPNTSYQLVFEDNFNYFDENKWVKYFTNWGSPVDRSIFHNQFCWQEIQFYHEDNVTTENGYLKLTAKKESYTYAGIASTDIICGGETYWEDGEEFSEEYEYTSGMVQSKHLFTPSQHIKVEAKIKLPIGADFWPAFWLFNLDEIDVFEFFSSDSETWRSGYIKSGKGCGTNYGPEDFAEQEVIWALEMNPYELKYSLNGVVFKEVYKYYDLDGNPITCGSQLLGRVVNENLLFPDEHRSYPIILNFALSPGGNGNPSFDGDIDLPASMYVDWVKVYSKKPNNCGAEEYHENSIVIEPNTYETWNTDRAINYQNIVVKENATLNIVDAEIAFSGGVGILIENGGNLELDHAILTSCGTEWAGVEYSGRGGSGSPAYILVKDFSKIENARIGISSGNRFYTDGNLKIEFRGGAGISNCKTGIALFNNHESVEFDVYCYIENCGVGISAFNSNNISLNKTTVNNFSQYGIYSVNSTFNINNANKFRDGDIAIHAANIVPLAGQLNIGNFKSGYNYFENNVSDILCQGLVGGIGVNVANCRFDNTSFVSTTLDGDNLNLVSNNLFNNTANAVWLNSTGDFNNLLVCNEFYDNDYDALYTGNNRASVFEENLFDGTVNNLNVGIYDGLIAPEIGSIDEAATNCFSAAGEDIYAQSTNQFLYHYFDDQNTIDCQEPDNPTGFNLNRAPSEAGGCDGTGVFKRLIIPTTENGSASFGANFNYGSVCQSCLIDSVQKYYTQYVHYDSLVTIANLSRSSTHNSLQSDLLLSHELLENWVNFSVHLSLSEENYAFANTVLSGLDDFKWKKLLYGLNVITEDYVAAQNVLNTLDTGSPEQEHFKLTQETYLDFLNNDLEDVMGKVSTIRTIAQSNSPSSAYAKALLRLLTGEIIDTQLPPASFYVNARNAKASENDIDEAKSIVYYPMPLSNEDLHIKSKDNIDQIHIYDCYGSNVHAEKNIDKKSATLDLSHLTNGIYIIRVSLQNGSTNVNKIILQ